MSKTKKVWGIIGNVVLWVFVALCILITVIAFSAQANAKSGLPTAFGKNLIYIETESMKGTCNKGDLIFSTALSDEEKAELKKDDIITFLMSEDINGNGELDDLNTHRIVDVDYNGGLVKYQTKGDNNENVDSDWVLYTNVYARYDNFRIPFLGTVINAFQNPTVFLCVIVIPLALFFIYEVIHLVIVIMKMKEKNGTPVLAADTEEEIKRRAIEEYLAQQKNAENKGQASEGIKPDEVAQPSESSSTESKE